MMAPSTRRVSLACALLLLSVAAFGACGGRTSDVGPGGSSSSGGSSGVVSSGSGGGSGSSSGGSSSSSGGDCGSCGSTSSSTGSSSGGSTSSGGTVCVFVDTSSYDTSCNTSSDCISITAGTLCSPACFCGGATINAVGQARYNAAVASIYNEGCPCPALGFPTCASHQCILCTGGPGDPPACFPSIDASTGACVNVNASSFDHSCKVNSDCVEEAFGTLCTGQCRCPTDTISASAVGAYDMAIAPILNGPPPPNCLCPSPGYAYCAGGTCALCPPGADCVGGGGSDGG